MKYRPPVQAHTMTVSLQGSHTPFVREFHFDPLMSEQELLDRVCIALGRYPTPDAVLHWDGVYYGHAGSHFRHPDLAECGLRATVQRRDGSMELILSRLRGWVFDVEVSGHSHRYVSMSEAVLRDDGPLLPGPAVSLAEYNAVCRARAGEDLPPDVERAIVVDDLLVLMEPELADPWETMNLYGVLAERGLPWALPRVAPIMRARPDLAVLRTLMEMSAGDCPPRLGKHGYMPVDQVRKLVEKFPELHPEYAGYGLVRKVSTASEVKILSEIIELGRTVGVFTARRGEYFQLTDFGREVTEFGGSSELRLTAAIVDARLRSGPEQVTGSQDSGDFPGAESFGQYLAQQEGRSLHERDRSRLEDFEDLGPDF